jgi:hypothetical protein
MPETWTITYTDANGRLQKDTTATNDTAFASRVRDLLGNLRISGVSAVLPGGMKLDEAALRAKYIK